MLRYVLPGLFIVQLASAASALTYDHAERAYFTSLSAQLIVTDGFTFRSDQLIYPSDTGAVADVYAEETGSVGVLDPLRQFSGHAAVAPTDLSWSGNQTGSVSGAVAAIQFNSLELRREGNPFAAAYTSGTFLEQDTPSVLTGSGTLTLGQNVVPFSFNLNVPGRTQSGIGASGATSFEWTMWTFGRSILTFTDGPLTYSAEINIAGVAYVPEPSTALLLSIGLMGLAIRRSQ